MDEYGIKEIREGFNNEEWVVIYGLFNFSGTQDITQNPN